MTLFNGVVMKREETFYILKSLFHLFDDVYLHHYIINDLFDGVKTSQNKKHHSFWLFTPSNKSLCCILGDILDAYYVPEKTK